MQRTTNYDEIQQWVESVGGKPAIVDHANAGSDTPGIRIDFPGSADERLLGENETKDISWNEFFKIFENEELAFDYEENPKGSDPTTWYRFEKRSE